VLPRLPGIPPGVRVQLVLNNAVVLSRRVYRTGLDLFDGVLDREGGDLTRGVPQIIALAKSRPKDPYGAVRDWLRGHPAPAGADAAIR